MKLKLDNTKQYDKVRFPFLSTSKKLCPKSMGPIFQSLMLYMQGQGLCSNFYLRHRASFKKLRQCLFVFKGNVFFPRNTSKSITIILNSSSSIHYLFSKNTRNINKHPIIFLAITNQFLIKARD